MKATERIWKEYHARLAAFIKSRVEAEDAQDVLQEVFLKIHTRIDSLKEDAKLESWLYQITRNTIIDWYRSKRTTRELPDWIEQPDTEEEESIRMELSACLAPMVKGLPVKYRIAVQMAEFENKTQKEVALREGLSLSGAKTRVQRGRALLKAMLDECCRFEMNRNNQVVSYEKKDTDCKYC